MYEQLIGQFDDGAGLHVIRLKQEVSVDDLQAALKETLDLHPLCRTRLMSENGMYYLAYNELEPRALPYEWTTGIQYGTKYNNYYPWFVGYNKDTLYHSHSHIVSDGGGMLRFLKTLLIRYFARQGVILPEGTDITAKDGPAVVELSEERAADLTADTGTPVVKPVAADLPAGLYETDPSKLSAYQVSFSKAEIKKIADEAGTTPFALMASLFARTYGKVLKEVLGEESGTAVLQVPFDCRRYWGSITDHNFSCTAYLGYDAAAMKDKSLGEVAKDLRRQLSVYMERKNQLEFFNRNLKLKKAIEQQPALYDDIKQLLAKELFSTRASLVFSYMGHWMLPLPEEIESELQDIRICSNPDPNPLVAVLGGEFGGTITLSLLQAMKEDLFIRKFREVCEENEVPFELVRVEVPHASLRFVREAD